MRRVLAVTLALSLAGCVAGPAYHGPITDHFDGKRFHDPEPARRTLGGLIKWGLHRHKGPWRDWTPNPPHDPPPERVADGKLRVTFVNHATVLVQMDGLNVLFDPIWSQRAGPAHSPGEVRHRPPGLSFDELPPIDVVVISHNHWDHCDLPTLAKLDAKFHPRFFVPLGLAKLLAEAKIRGAVELDWWDARPLTDAVKLVCVPARHDSGRGLSDQDRTLWSGWILDDGAGPVYFAGDTGYGIHFAQIAAHYPKIRFAMLPVGSYEPRWFMQPIHMNPADALRAQADLGGPPAMGIHHGTFAQADDGEDQPEADLEKALGDAREAPERFRIPFNGETFDVP